MIGEPGHYLGGAVGRSIIDHNQRPMAVRLRDHRGYRVTDPAGSIIGGDDNADAHAASVRIGS
jgi:hypothetical protein